MNSPDPGAFPFPTAERHDPQPAQEVRTPDPPPTESALDHGIEESFPASDPVSVHVSKEAPLPPCPPDADRPGNAAGGVSPLQSALRAGVAAGTFAGVLSSLVLAACGQRDARRSMAWVCGSFAAGLAVGCAAAEGRRRRSLDRD